jgi:hypothetical protein
VGREGHAARDIARHKATPTKDRNGPRVPAPFAARALMERREAATDRIQWLMVKTEAHSEPNQTSDRQNGTEYQRELARIEEALKASGFEPASKHRAASLAGFEKAPTSLALMAPCKVDVSTP